MTSHTSLLSLTDVTAGYGAGLVLKGVNLTVEKGQIVCVIGPNGSGKINGSKDNQRLAWS